MLHALVLAAALTLPAQAPSNLQKIGAALTGGGQKPDVEETVKPSAEAGRDWQSMPWQEVNLHQHSRQNRFELSMGIDFRRIEAGNEAKLMDRDNIEPVAVDWRKKRKATFDNMAQINQELIDLAAEVESLPLAMQSLRSRQIATNLIAYSLNCAFAMTERERRLLTHEYTVAYNQVHDQATERPTAKAEVARADVEKLRAEYESTRRTLDGVMAHLRGDPGVALPDPLLREAATNSVDAVLAAMAESRERIEPNVESRKQRIERGKAANASKQEQDADAMVLRFYESSLDRLSRLEALEREVNPAAQTPEQWLAWTYAFEAAWDVSEQLGAYTELIDRGQGRLASLVKQIPVMESRVDALMAERNHRMDPAGTAAPEPRPHEKLSDRALGEMGMAAAQELDGMRAYRARLEGQIPFAKAHSEEARTDWEALVGCLQSPGTDSGGAFETALKLAGGSLARDIGLELSVPEYLLDALAGNVDSVGDDLAEAEGPAKVYYTRQLALVKHELEEQRMYVRRTRAMMAAARAIAGGEADELDALTIERLLAATSLFHGAEEVRRERWWRTFALHRGSYMWLPMPTQDKPDPDAAKYIFETSDQPEEIKFYYEQTQVLDDTWPRTSGALSAGG